MRVAVFDRKAAELYVDDGNQIAFLPFNLAILFRLNDLLLRLKSAIDKDRAPTTTALQATVIAWPAPRQTAAQRFYGALTATTTDVQIDEATSWSDANVQELATGRAALATSGNRAADLTALVKWLRDTKMALLALAAEVDPSRIAAARTQFAKAKSARLAADTAARTGFASEPLPHVGEEVWRRLWEAARDYSVTAAYAGRPFPVTIPLDGAGPLCVLCQQPLSEESATRLQRFEAFVSDRFSRDARTAEAELAELVARLAKLAKEHSQLYAGRLSQITVRDPTLAV
jgi:hypothetical protein